MIELHVGDRHIEIRRDGQMNKISEWDEEVARALAQREHLPLTDAHWEVINIMRNYYAKYNISPIRKLLKQEIAEALGEAKADEAYLVTLFPNDVLVQGIRIAGLPKPLLDAELEPQPHLHPVEDKQDTAGVHFKMEFEFNGRQYPVYAKGNLKNLGDWSRELAVFMAEKEGIQLNNDHWEVIDFLRDFYFKYGITPMVKLLMKNMRQKLGKHKSSKEYLYDLFPGGPARQGSRIAGLPEPQGCIDP